MAIDWTFDLFAEAMDSVQALPMRKGVRPSRNLTDAQTFAVYVKTAIKFADFDRYYHIDDAVKDALYDMNFSDWYKDVFNQRPHFGLYLVGALCGVTDSEYSIARWTYDNPIQEHKNYAKQHREYLEKEAMEQWQAYKADTENAFD